MAPMSFSEATDTRTFGLLSSRVSQTLNTIARNGTPPTREDKELLRGGVALLERFIQGSRIVEGEVKSGLVPGPDSLLGFNQALNSLAAIEELGKNEGFTQRFRTLRDELNSICVANVIQDTDKERIKAVSEFFTTLGDRFYEDLARKSLEDAAPGSPRTSEELTDGIAGIGLR